MITPAARALLDGARAGEREGGAMRILAAVLVTMAFGCGSDGDLDRLTVTDASPAEAKLAAIDAHGTTVQRQAVHVYGGLLDDLDRKCKEDRRRIGDIAVKGVELLAEKNVRMTNLKFLQAMNESMPAGSESLGLSCAEIGAMLVTMIDRP